MCPKGKKIAFKKIMISHFFAEFFLILIYAQVNTNYYTAILYIYISILLNTYWVKFEIIVMVFVSYKCTNGNIHFLIRAL